MKQTMKQAMWLLFLSCTLILVCLPRFNRQDIGLEGLTRSEKSSREVHNDAEQYVLFTRFFRNQDVKKQLYAPFTYRPLVPFVASFLPCKPMTAINLVNLSALLIALFFLYKILEQLELDFPICIIGCVLFVFSFPTFYYGTVGYVDPVLISLLMISTFCILTEKWIVLTLIIAAGGLVKETIVILLPVLAAYLILKKEPWKKQILLLFVFSAIFASASCLARALSPDNYTSYIWLPSVERLLINASRPRSWISFLLSFGIPDFISLTVFLYSRYQSSLEILVKLGPFLIGFLTSIAVFAYSMVSAYADGRFIWISYPFSIPIAMVMLKMCLESTPQSERISGAQLTSGISHE